MSSGRLVIPSLQSFNLEIFKLTSLHHFCELTLIQIGASFDSYFKVPLHFLKTNVSGFIFGLR